MTPLLTLKNLSLTFPGRTAPALSGIDLVVRRGETLCLLGPSGCGKSTLLRLVAGLEAPSAGEVVWAGEKPEIGFVFQEPNLMPWADVAANVALPLELAGVGRRARGPRVAEALARVGLKGQERALPRELSGGMKMRVSLARALVDEPDLLLLDEPFAALDEITRWELNDALEALRGGASPSCSSPIRCSRPPILPTASPCCAPTPAASMKSSRWRRRRRGSRCAPARLTRKPARA